MASNHDGNLCKCGATQWLYRMHLLAYAALPAALTACAPVAPGSPPTNAAMTVSTH